MQNPVLGFYQDGDELRENKSWPAKDRVLKLFDSKRPGRLLDIGCFDGSKTEQIAKHIGASTVCGVDFLSHRLDQATARGIQVAPVDLNLNQPLPFEDGSFGCIYVGDVIEHVFSPDHLLLETFRLLSPGGYVVLTTPNMASWRNRIGLLFGWQPLGTEVSTITRLGNPFAPIGLPVGHIRVFTPRALVELAQFHGFVAEIAAGFATGDDSPTQLLPKMWRLVDHVVDRFAPRLSDEILVRLRKPSKAVNV